jgi:cytochrome c biogenesis protein CcmG/thiol:disulfide interchange protein DsbE
MLSASRMAQEFYSGKILYPVMVALLVLSLFFGFAILPRLFAGAEGGPLVGKQAPPFTLPVVANGAGAAPGGTLSLDTLQGSPVVLDFWATWCPPCRMEAPIVNKVAQRFKDRGLVVLGVDTGEPDGNARPWALQNGLSYPIVYDTDNLAAEHYGVSSMPTLVVISRAGKVTAVREGLTNDAELESLVRGVL